MCVKKNKNNKTRRNEKNPFHIGPQNNNTSITARTFYMRQFRRKRIATVYYNHKYHPLSRTNN